MTANNQSQIKKRVGNYPYVNVIFSTTTALFIIGLFSLFAFFAQKIANRLRNNIEIQVFLKNDLNQTEVDTIKIQLLATPYLDSLNNDPRIRYVSKENAAQIMIKETGDNFITFLGENPLRDAFIINLKENFYDENSLTQVEETIEVIQGVFEVSYTKNQISIIKDINENIQKIGLTISIFVLILLITIVILINSAIRLALYSQRFLIRSMQLVGATSFFIKKPFLLKATFHGMLSGFLASSMLVAVLFALSQFLKEFDFRLLLSQNIIGTGSIFGIIIFLGGLIGFTSSYAAVSRYLRMKLEELY